MSCQVQYYYTIVLALIVVCCCDTGRSELKRRLCNEDRSPQAHEQRASPPQWRRQPRVEAASRYDCCNSEKSRACCTHSASPKGPDPLPPASHYTMSSDDSRPKTMSTTLFTRWSLDAPDELSSNSWARHPTWGPTVCDVLSIPPCK